LIVRGVPRVVSHRAIPVELVVELDDQPPVKLAVAQLSAHGAT
jgi:hypothetical protein